MDRRPEDLGMRHRGIVHEHAQPPIVYPRLALRHPPRGLIIESAESADMVEPRKITGRGGIWCRD